MKRLKRIGSVVGAVSLATMLVACSTDSSTVSVVVEAEEEEVIRDITEKEVLEFQQSWGEGIVHIGEVHSEGGDYEAAASEHIERFYGYDIGNVLFKPTLASEKRFRDTFEGALSYFIGGNEAYPEDNGFAIAPWTDVQWENEGVIIEGNKAVSMGVYYFTPANGGEPVEVEYNFAHTRNNDGDLKIVLHGSHYPYSP
ncbi:hypothetical protein [Halalkalibacter krulwichiae]|uniref:Phosphoribosyl-AMP cyclohydrolase n=1 Tax=Halalkalibacter krulwichiae TaxID=199441 RepID=A0A1X9M5V7_9BACI|nr:hypothetical protein [Halalkalibacter krulwichiae]ARK28826.1 hypothetical protein BkAM31D_02580 [Halalkalibacter krulwichiae]